MKKDVSGMVAMQAAELKILRDKAQREGVTPIYFEKSQKLSDSRYYHILTEVSQTLWTYLGFSGLIKPWHDNADGFFRQQGQIKSLRGLFMFLEAHGINVEAYCILVCALADYPRYDRPALLFNDGHYKAWLAKLNDYASDRFVDVARFVLKFLELQVEMTGKALISERSVLGDDPLGGGKYLATLHKVADRIGLLASMNISYEAWMREKYVAAYNAIKDHRVYLNTIVNVNAFDPSIAEVQSKLNDPWREIKAFLNLRQDCVFPDGFIPKGWNISSVDFKDAAKIVKVTGDGFYYYADGTQRRGIRHYASNRYFIIKCEPSNFQEFKASWHNATLLNSRPTWEEYSKWAMFPNVWDSEGNSLIHCKDVKWRKR